MSRSATSSSADDHHEKEKKGKFVHFSAVETTMGICWFYRSHGFCRHDSCPYQHITSANDDLYKKKASLTTIISNDNNDSSTILEKPTLLDNNATSPNNNSIYCWISMAKELKFAASVLRRTFEENGFTLLTTKEDFAQFNSTNNNNKKLTTSSSTTNNNNNLNNEEENTTNYLPLFWGHVFPRNNIVKWYELPSYTLINHFVNSHELCNKSLMALNFQGDLTEKRVMSKSEFVPLSFYLPDQLNLFINHCENQKEAEKCIWIVKPGRSGEGRGIQIYESCQQVITGEYSQIPMSEIESGIISEKSLKLCKQKIVVSKYIDNPLLIENKKFDMRMYVLLIGGGSQERFGSNTTEEFHTYFYRDAIVRFASEDYTTDLDTLKNPFIHITNNSVNDKKNKIQNETITQKFGFFSNMYLPELIPCLEKMNIDWNVIEEQIKSLVRESLQFTILNPQKQDETFQQSKSRCFQLYGYDIMIDSNLKPHLLEVNSMPDLAGVSHSRILKGDFGLKSKLLANVLNLVRLQSFNTGISTFNGQVDDNNLFVKI